MKIEIKEKFLAQTLLKQPYTISDFQVRQLAEISDHIYFPKGSTVLGINQVQTYIYFIIEGLARSYIIDQEGNSSVRNFMLEGDFLIGESLFSDTSIESFDALEDLYCLRFKAETLRKLIFQDEDLKSFYIAMLEDTLRYKMKREYSFQNLDAKARYQDFQKQFGKYEKRIPQNQIASYIGIAKESFSRLKKSLK